MSHASLQACLAWPCHFSLRATLRVMTGTQICVALVCWDLDRGALASILLVGGWWTAVAVRSGHCRAAYSIAVWPLGAAIYLIFSLPLSPASYTLLQAWRARPDFVSLVAMCLATSLAALAVEPWIRRPWAVHRVVSGTALVGLTLVVYPAAWAVVAVVFWPLVPFSPACPSMVLGTEPTLRGLCAGSIMTVPYGAVAVVLSLHVVVPVGAAAAYLLGWTLATGKDLPPTERRALNAVERFQREGRDPIRCYHVARRIGSNAATALEALQRLWALRRVTWDPRHGYRRTGRA